MPRDFFIDRLHVQVAGDRARMGAAAGTLAAAILGETLRVSSSARVILASAPSQDELLATLTGASVDWGRVTIFHMDEYVGLSADHPASFRRYQRERFLSRVRPAAFHGIAGEAADAQAECERYAALLAEAPIDLVCLGIGENGHLAFNDPHVADFTDPHPVKLVELDQACRQQQVNDRAFSTIEAVPTHAITLTIPTLLAAHALVCAVPGPRKAQAVHDALRREISQACPASVLRTHANARLLLDEPSAALLG